MWGADGGKIEGTGGDRARTAVVALSGTLGLVACYSTSAGSVPPLAEQRLQAATTSFCPTIIRIRVPTSSTSWEVLLNNNSKRRAGLPTRGSIPAGPPESIHSWRARQLAMVSPQSSARAEAIAVRDRDWRDLPYVVASQ